MDFLKEFAVQMAAVPASSWPAFAAFIGAIGALIGALLSSVLTLLGVWTSNKASEKRLKTQLEHETTQKQLQLNHDASQKETERLIALRREVYLEAVEAATIASEFLGGLAQFDPTEGNLSKGLTRLAGSGAKIQIVGEPETALLVATLHSSYAQAFMNLLEVAQPAHGCARELKGSDELIASVQKEIDRLFAKMKELTEGGEFREDLYKLLQDSVNRSLAFRTELNEKRGEIVKRQGDALRDFNERLFAVTPKIAEQQRIAIDAIRKDLGLSISTEMQNLALSELAADTIQTSREMIDKLRNR